AIRAMNFSGVQRDIAAFPDPLSEASLSCAADGSLIAVLSKDLTHLHMIKNGVLSGYHFREAASLKAYQPGELLSEKGDAIKLPGQPILDSGPDIIKDLKLFIDDNNAIAPVFLVGGKAYVERRASGASRSGHLETYEYDGRSWEPRAA